MRIRSVRIRLTRLVGVLTALTLAVTACGSDDDDAGGDGASGDGDGVFPVSVEHKFGTTVVPERPVRVVSIGFKEQDWLYEFGVSPVAVRAWYGAYDNEINPWVADLVAEEPEEVLTGELSVEKVASFRPDLIIATYSGITKEQYELYSEVAPTIAGPVGSTDFNEPWREMTMLIGQALGQADKAEQVISDLEALFAQAREEHPELVGAEVIAGAAWSPETIGAYTSGDPRSKLLAELGIETPPELDELAEEGSFNVPLSAETAGKTYDLADDAVVLVGAPIGEGEPGAGPTLAGTTFPQSRIAEEGRAILLDTKATDLAFSFGSPAAIRFTLSHLVPQLVAAIDGDPATEVPASPETVS